MKNFIILITFSFGLSLYGGSDLFPFGMNYSVYEKHHPLPEDTEYKEKYIKSMDLCVKAGIKWWRPMFAFRWPSVQDSIDENYWNFDTEDSLVKWCGKRGLYLLPSIGYTAEFAWHTSIKNISKIDSENKNRYPPDPDYWDEYIKYVDTLIERYDGDGINDMPGLENLIPIKYWQFSNEPWGSYFLGDTGQYVEMYDSTRKALKAADPDAKIVGLCLTSIENKKKDLEWKYFDPSSGEIIKIIYDTWQEPLEYLIARIGPEKIDVVSHHIYHWNTDSFIKWTGDLRDIVGEDKPIWITETGHLNSGRFKAEAGTEDLCSLSPFATYTNDNNGVFKDTVSLKIEGEDCIQKLDTLLEINDTLILEHRLSWYRRDTIIYDGGPLKYVDRITKDTIIALDINDTLTIFDFWARERIEVKKHNRYKQDTSYAKRLDGIINTPNFLNNLKVFFFCADNTIHRTYYPPEIRFGNKPDEPTIYVPTKYYRQRLHSVYSVIDTNDDPYLAYETIMDSILLPSDQTLPNTTINTNETKTYQAMNSITADDFTINNGGKVAMEAGDIIHIQDGFRVKSGGFFYGGTNSRYGYGGASSAAKSITIPQNAKTSEKDKPEKEKSRKSSVVIKTSPILSQAAHSSNTDYRKT